MEKTFIIEVLEAIVQSSHIKRIDIQHYKWTAQTSLHFTKVMSLGRHLWRKAHIFLTVFQMFVPLSFKYKNPFPLCILIGRICLIAQIEEIKKIQSDITGRLAIWQQKKGNSLFLLICWLTPQKDTSFLYCGLDYQCTSILLATKSL